MSTIELPIEQIRTVCEKNLAQRLELFDSAATNRFNPLTSEFDFLVTFNPMQFNQRFDTYH